MDILVYSGPDVLPSSLSHVLSALRGALLSHYSIQTVTQQILKSQPWSTSCALLVFPELCQAFQSPSSVAIQGYVESGGSLLGFAFGASYSSRDPGGVAGISKDLQLRFYDNSTGSYIYPTSRLGNDRPRSIALQPHEGGLIDGVYENGSNAFSGFEDAKNVTVLAKYSEGGAEGLIAGLKCDVGRGRLALWAPNLENPLTEDPAASLVSGKDVSAANTQRSDLLKATLLNLGLRLPSVEPKKATGPLPQFLTSHPSKSTIVSQITDLIAAPSSGSQLSIFEDGNDTFHFHRLDGGLLQEIRKSPTTSDDSKQPKHIILCDSKLPDREETPLFNLRLYYDSLSAARTKQGCSENAEPWGFGEALLYGEVVTSTQTLLDK
jgi:biotin--protein ligase